MNQEFSTGRHRIFGAVHDSQDGQRVTVDGDAGQVEWADPGTEGAGE
jgi:hypothetical protein